MPGPHRVILTSEALSDLEGIADYIRQDSPRTAAIVAEKVLDAIDSLALMARRGRQVGSSSRRGTPIHAMVVRPFIVYYRIEDEAPAVYVSVFSMASGASHDTSSNAHRVRVPEATGLSNEPLGEINPPHGDRH